MYSPTGVGDLGVLGDLSLAVLVEGDLGGADESSLSLGFLVVLFPWSAYGLDDRPLSCDEC